jgi:hypothetical protein
MFAERDDDGADLYKMDDEISRLLLKSKVPIGVGTTRSSGEETSMDSETICTVLRMI